MMVLQLTFSVFICSVFSGFDHTRAGTHSKTSITSTPLATYIDHIDHPMAKMNDFEKFLRDARRWTAEDRLISLLEEGGDDDRSLALHFKQKGNESYAQGQAASKKQERNKYHRDALNAE
jgi:hypothetical protein